MGLANSASKYMLIKALFGRSVEPRRKKSPFQHRLKLVDQALERGLARVSEAVRVLTWLVSWEFRLDAGSLTSRLDWEV